MRKTAVVLLALAVTLAGLAGLPPVHAARTALPLQSDARTPGAAPHGVRGSVPPAARVQPAADGRWTITLRRGHTIENLASVAFTNPALGWVVGDQSIILNTTNGGNTWSPQSPGSLSAPLHAVAFTPNGLGFAVGEQSFTTTGSLGWAWSPSSANANLAAVAVRDAAHAWAVGGGGAILFTSDSGQSWATQSSGTDQALTGVAFPDSQDGWAVGWRSPIVHTADGGASWSSQDGGTHYLLNAITFSDAAHGWAVGYDGFILRTVDGGATWLSQNSAASGTSADLRAVAFSDARHGWVAGDGGAILHTTDGGVTWRRMDSGATANLHGLGFTDADHGWAVGDGGVILRILNTLAPVATVDGTPISIPAFTRYYAFQSYLHRHVSSLPSCAPGALDCTLRLMVQALELSRAAAALHAAPTALQLDREVFALRQAVGGSHAFDRLQRSTGVTLADLRTYDAAQIAIQQILTARFAPAVPLTQIWVKARHILVRTFAQEQKFLTQLADPAADFGRLARRYSIDTGRPPGVSFTGAPAAQSSARNGGWLSDPTQPFKAGAPTWITPLTPFPRNVLDLILSMSKGDAQGVRSTFGYHVIQVTDRIVHHLSRTEAAAQRRQVASWRYQQWHAGALSVTAHTLRPLDPYAILPPS